MAIFCKILMQQKRQVPLNLPELYIIFNSILNQSKGLRFSTQKQAVAKKAKAKVIFVKQCRRLNITHFLCPFLIFLYDIVSKLFIYYSLFTYLSRLFSIFVLFFYFISAEASTQQPSYRRNFRPAEPLPYQLFCRQAPVPASLCPPPPPLI